MFARICPGVGVGPKQWRLLSCTGPRGGGSTGLEEDIRRQNAMSTFEDGTLAWIRGRIGHRRRRPVFNCFKAERVCSIASSALMTGLLYRVHTLSSSIT
ncbi:hypothetical protein BDW02DRAFT_313214 [Decorospora gaudefroyi]|uniref:Uncharacterized protein n=1 Tax=Decorospora gaudefroyi TaxID=184978 RepID=A0A6A5JW15_9PLEO|nr:hypothetical protein BDW02DRAFT_313214 [Decorospora gaudefroyi]